ncbi:hypothetical protein [Devosia chinhatensis]|uniref:Uncharacterized protein n=1 Tax=Devosia chinhatensis TaxID=429727 RepID=A0A0F5FKI8_9HYPH|nr:hypothetical protein [Devosia chinhatensis]KKB09414.1 hypothetical protein VE26_05625 [Devosia chinhatensis]
MSGLELFDGDTKIRITYGARTVFTTDGTLINLLPQSMDISETFNVVFPDFSKDYVYNWRHVFSYSSLANAVGYQSGCATALTIPKQDFAQETTIVAAPADADIFVGRIQLTRTSAPSNQWNGENIDPLQPMGVSIPFISGSLLMEAKFGMARACSIYVSGGALKLHRQQSVSEPPSGWGIYGTEFIYTAAASGSGGENVNGGTPGMPVLQIDSRVSAPYQETAGLFADQYSERSRRGYTGVGANVCTIPNPASYNYGSTYQAVLTGSFGRRS